MLKNSLMLLILCFPCIVFSDTSLQALTVTSDGEGGQTYTVTLQILILMTLMTFLPAMLISMTSFTRIIIVLSLLRQAIGTQQTPNNQILLGISLFLTFFIMAPVFESVYDEAVQPYVNEEINVMQALEKASGPFRTFMLRQTRETDLTMFMRVAGYEDMKASEQVPFSLLLPAYVTSELKTAFQIGFLMFLPFLVIDLVVASILMSMGMMMLSPLIISLPFKIMLFVLADGWSLVIETLATSFYV